MLQRALLAAAALVFAIMLARFFEGGDYYDPARGRRHCGAPPQEIKSWSYTSRTLRPEDQAGLEQWLQKEPDQVNQLFGAFLPLGAAHGGAIRPGGPRRAPHHPRRQCERWD
jgi:hypothetical protein